MVRSLYNVCFNTSKLFIENYIWSFKEPSLLQEDHRSFKLWKVVTSLFVARCFQIAEFFITLTKFRSIEDADFDPEDDLPLVRGTCIDH